MAYESQFKSRRVALLVSMHLSYLYEPMCDAPDATPGLKTLCHEQRRLQAEWCRGLGIAPAKAEKQYNLVRWADQFSLSICCGLVLDGGFMQEVGIGPDGKKCFISKQAESHYFVRPWPFAAKRVELYYESRVLKQLSFKTDEALLATLQAAEVIENTVVLEGMR